MCIVCIFKSISKDDIFSQLNVLYFLLDLFYCLFHLSLQGIRIFVVGLFCQEWELGNNFHKMNSENDFLSGCVHLVFFVDLLALWRLHCSSFLKFFRITQCHILDFKIFPNFLTQLAFRVGWSRIQWNRSKISGMNWRLFSVGYLWKSPPFL